MTRYIVPDYSDYQKLHKDIAEFIKKTTPMCDIEELDKRLIDELQWALKTIDIVVNKKFKSWIRVIGSVLLTQGDAELVIRG